MTNVEAKIKPELAKFYKYLRDISGEIDIERPTRWLESLLNDTLNASDKGWQSPRHYYPGLTDAPWHDPKDHPTCKLLEDVGPSIFAEYFSGGGDQLNPYTQPDSSFINGTEWRAAILSRWGVGQEDASRYPETLSALADDTEIAEIIMFSVVKGGGKILPHCGPWNLRLTVHLGLKVPDNTWIRVGDEKRTWTPGKCLVFDDSFEHEVANESDESRVILLVDLWHPDLSANERLVLQPALMLLDDDYNQNYKAVDAIRFVSGHIRKAA